MYKYELYIPDSYLDDVEVVKFNNFDGIIDSIANILINKFNLTGLSLRDEEGYYRLKSGSINKMRNKVLYFYSEYDHSTDFETYCKELKILLKQESLLIICNGVVILC